MPDLEVLDAPEAGPHPCCAVRADPRMVGGMGRRETSVHIDSENIDHQEPPPPTPGGLASGHRIIILGFEVYLFMTGNDPRMWVFSLLEMNTEPGCPSIGIFLLVSAVLEEQLRILFSPPTPVGSS